MKPAVRNKFGLGCDLEKETAACRKTEARRINYWLKRNQSSKATALGGLNRMRAYSQGRFYAANSSNYVLEYRLNYSEKRDSNELDCSGWNSNRSPDFVLL